METVTITEEDYLLLSEKYQLLQQDYTVLKEELSNLKRLIFGHKRERFLPQDSDQIDLFDEQEITTVQEKETVTYQRDKKGQKGKAKRLLLPAHLPREEEIIEPEHIDLDNSTKIGEKVSEVLEYTPGKFYVHKTVRPVYKIKHESVSQTQEDDLDQEDKIVVAPLPSQVIPHGNAGASLLAYIMVSKFIDHLPYYRQVKMFKRDGMTIPESTITGWFAKICNLLTPLYELLEEKLAQSDYIQIDESPMPVLSKDKPGSTHKGYMWVSHLPKEKVVLFKYDPSRAQAVANTLLANSQGCVQTDGYVGYEQVSKREDITHICCMAHARRKFEKALDNDKTRASHAMTQFQLLYAIERFAKNQELTTEEITDLRQTHAQPILNELHNWMLKEYPKVLPKSGIGKAISYTTKLWKQLTRYVENGEWQIDNNWVENKIRPLALGRKNYLFCGSNQHAQRAAMIYSFFGTCQINDINPLEWLTKTLRKLPDTKLSQLEQLLPTE